MPTQSYPQEGFAERNALLLMAETPQVQTNGVGTPRQIGCQTTKTCLMVSAKLAGGAYAGSTRALRGVGA
jgi:hypothetical protein